MIVVIHPFTGLRHGNTPHLAYRLKQLEIKEINCAAGDAQQDEKHDRVNASQHIGDDQFATASRLSAIRVNCCTALFAA